MNEGKLKHSIKVPRVYKEASKIFREVSTNGGSLKNLLYSSQHVNKKITLKLVSLTLKNYDKIDLIIKKSKILINEPRLDPWLAGILITELLFGKKEFKLADSKPIQTVLSYKNKLEVVLKKVSKDVTSEEDKVLACPRYVRVNTLKNTPDEVIKMLRDDGWQLLPRATTYEEYLNIVSQMAPDTFIRDYHLKEILTFPGGTEFHRNELYQNQIVLLQDKASCLASYLLNPSPGDVVVDACAAPGMKTTHLSAMMKNKGVIYAIEQSESRHNILKELVTNAGCNNVETIHLDSLKLNQESYPWCSQVEYVLVDPTCSGSGMNSRTNIYSKEKSNAVRLKRLSGFQSKLLFHALTEFPNVKRVVYSTCSVSEEENEAVVDHVLENPLIANKFHVVNPAVDWSRRGSSNYKCGEFCLIANPEEDFTNGFFVAVIERKEGFVEDQLQENVLENKTEKVKKKKKEKINTKETIAKELLEIKVTEQIEPRKKKRKNKEEGNTGEELKIKKKKKKRDIE